MLSEEQFGEQKSAMPLDDKFDGPTGDKISSEQNDFAANEGKKLPYPGFGD